MDGCGILSPPFCSPYLSLILCWFILLAMFIFLPICAYLRVFHRGSSKQMGRPFASSKNNPQGDQNHEKIPVQFEGTKYSSEGITKSLSAQPEPIADVNLSLYSTGRATPATKNLMSSNPQGVPSILLENLHDRNKNPFVILMNIINYFPSAFPSGLSRFPAIYQAARVAAASLPTIYVDLSIQSNTMLVGEALEKEASISSCTSFIVFTTVAAASAWWRDHGLLPSRFGPNLAFDRAIARAMKSAQVHEDNTDSKEKVGQTHKQKAPQIDFPEENETNRITKPCSALLEPSSSPDSCESLKLIWPPKSTNYFASFLASVLSQDPALYQAASVAAASLQPTYVDFSIQSNTILVGEALEKESSISSCTSAIVLATIAAAAVWWRGRGLLPSQFQPNHAFTQAMARAIESAQVHKDNTNSKEKVDQTHKQKAPQIDFPEENETNGIRQGKKKHDPSSCDSNTTPSSEVEKDAGLNKKEVKGVNEQGEQGPSIVQEFRDALGEIKSCTEGLKQCLQALEELLSRGAQPQSLSAPHQDGNLAMKFGNEEALEVAVFADTEEKNNTGREEGS